MKGYSTTDIGILVLRVGLGLTMLFFGSQKALGLFGGPGYAGTIDMMHSKMGIPVVFAHLAIMGEFLGGLGVLVGLLTRIAAFGIACTMATATFISLKAPGVLTGIFSGAPGADPTKLFFSGSLFTVALAVLILGSGGFSIDNKLFRKSKR